MKKYFVALVLCVLLLCGVASAARAPRVGNSGTIGPVCADLHTGQMFYVQLMQLPCGKGKKLIYFHVRIPKVLRGPRGPRGIRGPIGPAGIAGPAGPKGATGAQGIPGTAAAKGATGPPGPPGAKGTTGIQGTQGLQGVRGPTGPTGESGLGGSLFYLCINANGTPVKFGGIVDGTPDCDPGHDGIILKVVFQGPPIVNP
jgi:Collagen triple helix repeat (20 copies)